MKKVLLIALTALTFASCQKEKGRKPQSSLDFNENYAALNIKTSAQVVKMAVTANVLNLVYNEDVTLILDSAKLNDNWAVHLKEDFSGTQLCHFDYHSLTKYGVNATNWVDDNLNNVVIHSSKDTLINNKMFVKKRITRSFVYQKAYNSAEDATTVLNQLLKQTEIIGFSAYYAPSESESAATVNTAKLTYAKM
jgi:hypothetical protein